MYTKKKTEMWLFLGSSYMFLVLRYKGWPTLFSFLHAGQILDPQTRVLFLSTIENIGKMDRNAV